MASQRVSPQYYKVTQFITDLRNLLILIRVKADLCLFGLAYTVIA